jgi:hypothetical protein
VKALVVVALLAAAAGSVEAQVGYPPDRSPYRDKDANRDWTLFAGRFSAERDPVGVAPTQGPIAGVRWQMYLTGPLYFAVRLAGGSIERTEIDPTKVIAERFVRTEKVPMVLADASVELSLTGHKTWRGLSPFVNGGVGFTADLRGRTDIGDYRFGIPFTMTAGTGLNWSLGNAWALRFDWANYIYRVAYPNSYYLKTTEDPPVRGPADARSFWRRNQALLVGVSYLYPRR